MKGFAGAAKPPQQTSPLGFPPLSPARGERGTGGERGHVIAAKYQNLAEQGKSGEMTFLQWTQVYKFSPTWGNCKCFRQENLVL
jgi:hypothetical protein